MISQHQSRTTRWLPSSPRLQAVVAGAMCLISAAVGSHVGSSGQKMADAAQAADFDSGAPPPAAMHSSVSSSALDSVSTSALEFDSSSAPAPATKQQLLAGQGGSPGRAATPGGADAQAMTVSPVRTASVMRRPEPRVLVPMIFREVSPAAGLSGAQVATIDQMRNQFNQKVGTPSNPSDPQYRARWVSAQVEMDDQLRSYLGWEKFNQYQQHAALGLR